MKLSFILLAVGMLNTFAIGYSQNTVLSVSIKDGTLSDLFNAIESSTDYRIFYKSSIVNESIPVNIITESQPVSEILSEVLGENNLSFDLMDKVIIITSVKGVNSQSSKITGKVIDSSTEEPLPGVYVIIEGTNKGVITDISGNFSIEVPDQTAVLLFSFVGYNKQKLTVGNQTVFAIKLDPEIQSLESVVVVGYGVQKKSNLTGSVSAVKGEEIATRTFSDARQALQGLSTGMSIVDRGGVPGEEDLSLTIRGISSISASSAPLVLVDGIEMDMKDVSSNDIESISILKDAASSAIYGSRAANGVVLITTKRGHEGNFKVSYSSYFGLQKAADLPESVTSQQYLELVNEAYVNAGLPAKYSDDYITNTVSGNDPLNYPFVNLFNELFRNSPIQNHTISMTGGNKLAKVSFSANYLDQDGLVANVNSKRYGFRLNNDLTISKRFTLQADISLNNRLSVKPDKLNSALKNMMDCSPIHVLKYPNGIYGLDKGTQSALAQLEVSGQDKTHENFFNVKVGGQYQLLEGLKATASVSYKQNTEMGKNYTAAYDFYDPTNTDILLLSWTPSQLTESRSNINEIYLNGTVDYTKKVGEHNFHALAGAELSENKSYYLTSTIQNLYSNDLTEINTGDPSTLTGTGYKEDWALISYFGRFNYSFKEKYLFEANARYDGSSRFDIGNKWAVFPSVSAAWRISSEDFMMAVPFISSLKLRGSWGQLGNQNIGLYKFSTSVTADYPYNFNDTQVNGYMQTYYANKDVTWETTEILDFGLDMTLWKGKLDVVFDWYKKDTKDVLLTLPISSMTGLEASETNAGQIRNKGWELTMTHNNNTHDLKYSIGVNLSDVKNELIDFAGMDPVISGFNVIRQGSPVNAFYGYRSNGLFQSEEEINAYATQPNQALLKPGDIKLLDLDDNGVINDADRTIIGSSIPRYTLSVNLNLEYKGFDLNTYLQGVLKSENYFYGAANEGPILEHFTTTWILDRWTPTNTDGTFPRIEASSNKNNYLYNDFWIRNAGYMRLKNLQIGYTLPKSSVRKLNIEKLRVYLSGTNLFTITKVESGFDPETYQGSAGTSSFYYPPVSIFSAGVQVEF